MIKGYKSNIFSIPANYHFFESFFFWLSKNFSGSISDLKIFLPNQRSCRELRELFLQKNSSGAALLLPKIKAISDLSFEDFFDFLPQEDVKQMIDEILRVKAISGIDHLFFLSQEISNLGIFGENLDAAQSLSIAGHLKNLFDEIEREGIDPKILSEVDDSELPIHRQITLDFLQNFHIRLKNSLIKNDIFFSTSYQNFIVEKFSKALKKYGSQFPLIIAGSTGSVAASRNLIQAIAQQNNGYVILHGADLKQNFSIENHPQFYLNQLIDFLGVDKKQIDVIAETDFCLSDESRQELIASLMLPAEETQKWQKISLQSASKIQVITAKDELEEAQIISQILCKEFFATKKIAVISNNQKFAKLLKYRLQSIGLPFNDSRDVGVFSSNLVNFILLIIDLLESDFASPILLAVLQNPLCEIKNKTENLRNFENDILRQDRVRLGLSGLQDRLQNSNLKIFFDDFYQNLEPLMMQNKHVNISAYSLSLIEAVENLAGKKFVELLEVEEAYFELFEFFEKLKKTHDFFLNAKNASAVFKTLFSQISFFEKSDAMASIQLLSTVEARLLNFDLTIVASVNEGDFPEIEAENWLGKKIKKDLGVDKRLKKSGQNAYDFCNYLSNKEIILTRSLTSNGALSSPSPFLLKLETLGKKLGINFAAKKKYFSPENSESLKVDRPQPRPEVEFRPKKLAITDISKLISDPYSIYAKRILRLKELPEIDFEPSYAEFGSFVHKALEEFVKNPQESEKFLENSRIIFDKYFLSDEAKLVWWPKFENIFIGFTLKEREVKTLRNLTELEVKMVCAGVLINGKIDRITFDEDGAANIFDYKTGQLPTKNEVIFGSEPQLTIAALMVLEGNITKKISTLNYWKLSFSSDSEIKKISTNEEEIKILAAAAKSGLERLLAYFADKNNGYIATPNLENYQENEYSHLSRIKEWQ